MAFIVAFTLQMRLSKYLGGPVAENQNGVRCLGKGEKDFMEADLPEHGADAAQPYATRRAQIAHGGLCLRDGC